MATSIEERILDLVAAAMATITTGNGYEQTVAKVARASQASPLMEFKTNEIPGLQIRHIQTASAPHLRGALECQIDLEIMCIVQSDAADEKLSDLIADVLKVLDANKRWDAGGGNFLARRTWIANWAKHEEEIFPAQATAAISCSILFRADVTNLYAVKDI